LGPVHAIITCLRKTLNFTGRATRSEFWGFAPVFFLVLLCYPTLIIPILLPVRLPDAVVAFLPALFCLMLVTFLAAAVRRARDSGSSWLFVVPTAFVMPFALLFGFLLQNPIPMGGGPTGDPNPVMGNLLYAIAALCAALFLWATLRPSRRDLTQSATGGATP
jgi:uncharacterized membrane protein YhaH (DUF805 family)